MKVTVFGSTGMVGQYIVNQGVAHGHTVCAFGRNVFETFSTERKYLELFKGYLFSESDIKDAIKGSDAVLSAIGGAIDGTDKARSLGMKKIVAAMDKKGPKRIIAIGGFGVLNADEESYIFESKNFPQKYRAVTAEHFHAYETLRDSNLDWTFLCPPEIKDAPSSGEYRLNKDFPAEGQPFINAGDLADIMMRELKKNEYLKCRVGIAAK